MTSQAKDQARTPLQNAAGTIAAIIFTADLIAVGQVVFAILLSDLLDYLSLSMADLMAGALAPILKISGLEAVIENSALDTHDWNLFNLGARVLLIVLIFAVATCLYLYFKQDKEDKGGPIRAFSWGYMVLAFLLIMGASIRFTFSESYTLSQFIGYVVGSMVVIMLVTTFNGVAGRTKWLKEFAYLWMPLLLLHILLLILRLLFAGNITMNWLLAGNVALLLYIGYLVTWFINSSADESGGTLH